MLSRGVSGGMNALADEIARRVGRARWCLRSISNTDVPSRIDAALAAQGLAPHSFVDDAGFGLVGPAAMRDRDEQLAMIELNVRTLVELSLRVRRSA